MSHTPDQPRYICKTNRSTGNRDEWRARGKKYAESISIIFASAAWSSDVKQTDRDVRVSLEDEQPPQDERVATIDAHG